MNKCYYLTLVLLFFNLYGCQPEANPSEYITWFEQNAELVKYRELGNYEIRVTYRNGLYNFLSSDASDNLTPRDIERLQRTHCFFLEIFSKDQPIELTQVIDGNINYLMSGIQKDFTLELGNETLSCKLHHFERSFNLKKSISLIAVFETFQPIETDVSLVFRDNILNTGRHTFRFSNKTITDLPNLKI